MAAHPVVWPPQTFADHFENAVAWLYRGYGSGDALSEEECKTIVRVLWSRYQLMSNQSDSAS